MNKNMGIGVLIVLALIIVGVVMFSKNDNVSPQPAATSNSPANTETPETNPTNPTNTEPVADGSYVIVTEESQANWSGSKTLIANYVDRGTIDMKEGAFVVTEVGIKSGSVVFDMTSIAAVSTGKESGESMLTNHLKSKDFFEVEVYPTATFVFTDATKESGENMYMVSGDLTMKDVTAPVSFPVEAYLQDGKMMVKGSITLDRTKWNVRYGSDNFFDNLGNNVIDDEFTVALSIVAVGE